jgi:hypothetical protein
VSVTVDTKGLSHQWLSGRQKGVLASFVVGTIDQLLFAALRSEGHSSEFEAVLAGLRVPRIGESRLRTCPDRVVADRADSPRANRA